MGPLKDWKRHPVTFASSLEPEKITVPNSKSRGWEMSLLL